MLAYEPENRAPGKARDRVVIISRRRLPLVVLSVLAIAAVVFLIAIRAICNTVCLAESLTGNAM